MEISPEIPLLELQKLRKIGVNGVTIHNPGTMFMSIVCKLNGVTMRVNGVTKTIWHYIIGKRRNNDK